MSFIDAIDISNYQGVIDYSQVPQPIVIIKASEGTTFLDPYLFRNYDEAKHKHGKTVGMYHFARGLDPVAEANWFIQCCQPLEQDDVFVLDWEIQHPNPVGWCTVFITRVHELTGVWPLFYANGSTINAYDWSPVRNNCGTWVAWYGQDPNGPDLAISGNYVMHQYTSSGTVPGVNGSVDLDAWFGTLDQFKAYGWNHVAPPPPPSPAPVPTPPPAPIPIPAPLPKPPVAPPTPSTPVSHPPSAGQGSLRRLINAILRFFDFKT